MLQRIRKKSGGWIVKVLIGAIAVTFVFWGTSSLWSLFIEPEQIAEVNDEAIYLARYEQVYSEAKREEERKLGVLGVLSREQQRTLRDTVLEDMINDILIQQEAENDGIGLSARQLDSSIVNEPAFQIEGRFDRRLYERFLRSSRIESRDYKNYLLRQFRNDAYLSGLINGIFYTPSMLEDYVTWQFQEHTYQYARLPRAQRNTSDVPREAQLRAFYEEKAQDYFLPDRYEVQYVRLAIDETLDDVIVSEDEINDLYNDRYGALFLAANVTLRHILFSDPDALDERLLARAAQLRATIDNRSDFIAAAATVSQDVVSADQGGALGTQLVEQLPPSFIEVLRALPPGENMTAPFRSPLGVHLVWVDERPAIDAPSLSEVADELIEELRFARVEEVLLENAERLADYIQTTEGLDRVTVDLGYDLHASGLLTANSSLITEFGPVFTAELPLLDVGEVSDVLWLDDGSFLAFEMLVSEPARLLGFDDVRAEVQTDYQQSVADAHQRARLAALAADINEGRLASADVSAGMEGLHLQAAPPTYRAALNQTEIDAKVLAASRHVLPAANYSQLDDGSYVFFIVEDLALRSFADLEEEQQSALRTEYLADLYASAQEWLLALLNAKASIDINIISDAAQ